MTTDCCGMEGTVLGLWWETLPLEREREIAESYPGPGPMMLLAHEYTMPRKPRPRLDVSACYPDQLHGTGVRIVVIGCNVRWPKRPVAVLLCAECGHTRNLERPPRGWPTPRRPRCRSWLARMGYQCRPPIGSSTVHRGVAVMHARPIGDDRDQ